MLGNDGEVIGFPTNACHPVSLRPLMQFNNPVIYCCFALTFPIGLVPSLGSHSHIMLPLILLWGIGPFILRTNSYRNTYPILESLNSLHRCLSHPQTVPLPLPFPASPPNSPLLTSKSDSSLSHTDAPSFSPVCYYHFFLLRFSFSISSYSYLRLSYASPS